MDSLPEVTLYNLSNILEQMNQFSVSTLHYRVRRSSNFNTYKDTYISETVYEPLQAISGDSIEEISKTNSDFQKSLQSVDQKTDYIAFLVREDCFAAFRNARKVAWDKGFKVGWEPAAKSEGIVFTSGSGRSVGVQ